TNKNSIEIGWFNINNNKYHKITDTHAWCWQQGSRLRWSNNKDVIIYNDCIDNEYCCLFYNIMTNKIIQKVDYALYDITPNEKFGLSLNFSRLQRLRPGYGYDILEDHSKSKNAPDDDGVFLIDISNNSSKLIISLKNLAKLNDKEESYQHYINHISISPSGEKFIFFHIYVKEKSWVTQLISANIDGTKMTILENEDLVSHYTWKSDDELLITGIDKSNSFYYRLYEVNGKYKKDITNKYLKQDGHPTFIAENVFVTDTYPINNYQIVFTYDISKKLAKNIVKLYSDPRLFEERRCDLHPKIDHKNNLIFIDSTYKKGKRSVIMIGEVKNAK
ncbi:MAG: hypothetical protein K6D97_01410, partial [Clostridia bacterium]|nr:hypothetical protein [Clostridia bacterium]